jgi:hypothetical protein
MRTIRKTIGRWVDGAKSNERRYMANQELKHLADMTHPWTVEALHAAVKGWLRKRGALESVWESLAAPHHPEIVPLFRQGGLSGAYYVDDTDDPDGYFVPQILVR